jgi:hypothetical protein
LPYAILETRSLGCEPLIERWCDSVEIFEEALAKRLNEIAGIRGRIGTGLEDCKRIDPALPDIDPNAIATDLYEAGNMAINDAVELGKRMAQAHPGLRVSRPIPQQADKTTSRNAIALREAQAGH